ncbi:MAG: glycosyltransferase family 2 protein [Clostridium sp.]|nr:glycosyltransferase family 2 protein [Clostridium sp.]
MPKISVIIPVFNVEKYIDVCLDSLLTQSFTDFEIICIDDSSTDKSLNILKNYEKFDRRIKIIDNKQNQSSKKRKSPSSSRNIGITEAKGDYVTFVDSDDWISPVMLEKLYKNIRKYKSDYVFCNMTCINENTKDSYIWDLTQNIDFQNEIKKEYFCEKEVSENIYFNILPTVCAKFFKRSFIKDLRFPEDLMFEDVPFSAECFLRAKRISYDKNPYYFYRRERQGSLTTTTNENFKDIFIIKNMLDDIFKKYNKYEKYKTLLLIHKMKEILERTYFCKGLVQEEMFEQLKQTFCNIDFSLYDLELLNKLEIFKIYTHILKTDYSGFRDFMKLLQQRKTNV